MEGRNLELGRGSPCRDSGKQQNKLSSLVQACASSSHSV
uniref:(California timema) hypothetical protein n=1 Tax=Timema californicum TaxID=61474 RepID=A0A7R9JF93_TIMCA|nr:unnamed protein product [Timema californicum]